jgi:hypothetical protein
VKLFSSSAVSSAIVGAALLLCSRAGLAQETAAAAQLLFEQGRDLLRAGQIERACPKLLESQRLGPATGTLLALAMCHEAQGKLSSAWAEYAEVAFRAARDGQTTREGHARAKVQELKLRLSSLEVRIPLVVAAYAGVEVRRNGVLLGEAAWNMPVPVDGGAYEVEVTAAQRETWRQTVSVASERDVVVAAVPELAEMHAAARPALVGPAASLESAAEPKTSTKSAAPVAAMATHKESTPLPAERSSTLMWSGIVVGGAGIATCLVGAGFFASSYQYKRESERACEGPACEASRDDARDNAWNHGNWATGLGIGGGALIVTGAVLYLLQEDESEPNAATSRLHVDIGRDQAVIGITGTL